MKKSDSATGMIIEVPESMTYKSKFPYPGFWSGAYPLLLQSLMKETPLGKENRALVNEALNTSIGMLNGEYSIFLTEKMWSLGELMNLNPLLPIEGKVDGLGYIKNASDGGRMQVAAMLFEPAITAMINQSSGVSNSQANVAMFGNELNALRADQLKLNTRLAELEATTPSETQVIQKEAMCNQIKQMLMILGEEIRTIEMRMSSMRGATDERLRKEAEFEQVKNQVFLIQSRISAGTDTQADRMTAGKLKQRMENLGLALKRAPHGNSALERDYSALLHYKKREFKQCEEELKKCSAEAAKMRGAYADGIKEGQEIWNRIKVVTQQIENTQSSVEKAQNSVSAFSNQDSRNLVKVWVAHLSKARAGLEGALFRAKFQATQALSRNPRAVALNSQQLEPIITDYQDYNAALTDIADRITDSEYDLLEQIGRLGLSMMYVPGPARILALADMPEPDRAPAYRNLIEEILAQGQRITKNQERDLVSVGIRDLGIKIQATDEMKEVRELLRHLADSRLNFKYGGAV